MAGRSRTSELETPSRIDHGGSGTPHYGGGDGSGDSGDASPDYYQNLRRYRLFVFLVFIGVFIFFTALSSAYIIRRGNGHVDWQTGAFVRDWQPLTLPSILWMNTLLLALSSCALEFARRNLVRQVAIAPAVAVPGVAREKKYSAPWLALTLILGGASGHRWPGDLLVQSFLEHMAGTDRGAKSLGSDLTGMDSRKRIVGGSARALRIQCAGS